MFDNLPRREDSGAFLAKCWGIRRYTPVESLHQHILAVLYHTLLKPEDWLYFGQQANAVCTQHMTESAQQSLVSWKSEKGSRDGLLAWSVLFEHHTIGLNLYLAITGEGNLLMWSHHILSDHPARSALRSFWGS